MVGPQLRQYGTIAALQALLHDEGTLRSQTAPLVAASQQLGKVLVICARVAAGQLAAYMTTVSGGIAAGVVVPARGTPGAAKAVVIVSIEIGVTVPVV
jgi:hypothetical protein